VAGRNLLLLGLLLVIVIVLYAALQALVRSPWGRVLKAIREDETAAESLGKNAFALRLQSFVIGSAVMGLGGALGASFIGYISPEDFMPILTFQIWSMLIVGGSGNNKGAVLGAVLMWAVWTLSGSAAQALLPATMQVKGGAAQIILIGLVLMGVLVAPARADRRGGHGVGRGAGRGWEQQALAQDQTLRCHTAAKTHRCHAGAATGAGSAHRHCTPRLRHLQAGQQIGHGARLEVGVRGAEGLGHLLVLVLQHAAGGVHQPPALSRRAALARMACCLATSSCTPAGDWRHFRSGLRRSVPRPEHGASTSTRSSLPARRLTRSSRSCAMATGCTLDRPLRARRGLSASSRCAETSKAYSRPVLRMVAPMARVLPPAPAQKSATISPRCASSSRASSCEPSSCTSTAPRVNRSSLVSAGLPSMRRPQGEYGFLPI
jgi:hypothetical protein